MNKTTEALHKALKVLNCLNNDRVYETAWVKGAINACEEALSQNIKQLNDEYLQDTYVEGLSQEHTMTYEQGFAHGYEAHRVEQAHGIGVKDK